MDFLSSLNTDVALNVAKAVALGVGASSVAIIYSEILYTGTLKLYKAGKLQRYYPLPGNRGVITAWINAMSFTVPTALYAIFAQRDLQRSFNFNPLKMAAYMLLYMVIHDTFFFAVHRTSHLFRFLYNHLHAYHHDFSYSMNVYTVGHAEIVENFIQVGLPWLAWTGIAGHNWWYWMLPLSFVLFTTLVGHSGYRSAYWLMIFHPFALPVALFSGKWLLNTGDHQMHHSRRRVNFGLFWNFWDKYFNTYMKCDIRAHKFDFWEKWAKNKENEENSAQAKKWLGRHNVSFAEVEWGF